MLKITSLSRVIAIAHNTQAVLRIMSVHHYGERTIRTQLGPVPNPNAGVAYLKQKKLEEVEKARLEAEKDRLAQLQLQEKTNIGGGMPGCEKECNPENNKGCHPASVGGHQGSKILPFSKVGKGGESFPLTLEFYMQGSPTDVGSSDPLFTGNWKAPEDGQLNSPWRRAFAPGGQLKEFAPGKSSHLIKRGVFLTNVTNQFDFALGFFTTGKVSRRPECPGLEAKIEEVCRAFSAWEFQKNPDNPRTLSFVEFIPPRSQTDYHQHVVYRLLDSSDSAGSSVFDRSHAPWIGKTHADFEKAILNNNADKAAAEADPDQRVAFLDPESALVTFIDVNWAKLLANLNYAPNINNDKETWKQFPREVYPDGSIPEGMDPNVKIIVRVVNWRIAEAALAWIKRKINQLPFENFGRERLYLTRLDGKNWEDSDLSGSAYALIKMDYFFQVAVNEPQLPVEGYGTQ